MFISFINKIHDHFSSWEIHFDEVSREKMIIPKLKFVGGRRLTDRKNFNLISAILMFLRVDFLAMQV